MSICNPCTPTTLLPRCLTDLTIGNISSLNAAAFVYIMDITTDRLMRMPVTSTGTGLIIADVSNFTFMENHSYQLWITLANANNIEDFETITIDATDYTCFALNFHLVKDSEGDSQSYTNITLTPA